MTTVLHPLRLAVLVFALLVSTAAAAQQPGDGNSDAAGHYATALEARDAGELETALRELELAYRLEPDPQYVHTRILVLEELGHASYALRLLRDHRSRLETAGLNPTVWQLEERLRQAVQRQEDTGEPDVATDPDPNTDADPDTNVDTDATATTGTTTDAPNTLGWIALGSGVALTAAGSAFWISGLQTDARLECTPNSGLSPEDCDDDGFGQISDPEYNRLRSRSRLFVALGVAGVATGLAAAGFGVYRLLRPAPQPATALRLHVTPSQVSVVLNF